MPFCCKSCETTSRLLQVENSIESKICLDSFLNEILRLDEDANTETSFLIFPNSFEGFDDYLDLVILAEKLIFDKGYEGVYQVASFHPLYQFDGTKYDDAANYTNRSVYPMLHLLREERIERALENFKSPESIPDNNINFAREKGLVYMKLLRESCL